MASSGLQKLQSFSFSFVDYEVSRPNFTPPPGNTNRQKLIHKKTFPKLEKKKHKKNCLPPPAAHAQVSHTIAWAADTQGHRGQGRVPLDCLLKAGAVGGACPMCTASVEARGILTAAEPPPLRRHWALANVFTDLNPDTELLFFFF